VGTAKNRLRHNVFDLVPYLREQGIVHIVAHPFYDMNNRLHIEHFEHMLLLFDLFELNGSRDDVQNQILQQILASLTAKDIELLADKHSLEPAGERPWVKTLTAGSDDHSSLNIARAYTRVPEATGVQDFLQGLRQGRAETHSQPATARTMGHNLYAIAYQFYKSKFNLDRHVQKDALLRFVDSALTGSTAILSFSAQAEKIGGLAFSDTTRHSSTMKPTDEYTIAGTQEFCHLLIFIR
jgi:hypothetical protein